jgi:hypothetical protein
MLVGGRYRLSEAVGQGGMGRVWRGYDQVLNRVVAVKEVILPPQSRGEHAELLARMMREAQAAARLDHPSVITIYDVVEHEGSPWIVMQFVSGASLRARIDQDGPLPWPEVAEIGEQIAEALAVAHAAGIVHRDLKPDNILLSGRRAIVTDFGIARITDATTQLTGTGVRVGTPVYMAPENLDGGIAGPTADLWALGATLYAAVEGTPPFGGATMTALIAAILTRAPAPPRHAGPLLAVLGALLSKDPAQRPDALATARALAACRAGQTGADLGAGLQTGAAPGLAYPPTQATGPGVPPGTQFRDTVTGQGRPWTGGPGDYAAAGSARPAPRTGHPSFPDVRDAHAARPGAAYAPPPTGPASGTGRRGRRVRPVVIVVGAATAAAALGTVLALHGGGSQSPGAGSAAGQHGDATASAGAPKSPGAAVSLALPASETAALTATLADPYGTSVASVAFGPGGTLAEGNGDGGTYLWSTATRSVIGTHAGFTFKNGAGNQLVEAAGVAFGPNGVLAIANGATYLWNAGTQAVTATFGSDEDGDTEVAFGPDSIVAVPDGASTSLWNAETKSLMASLSDPGSAAQPGEPSSAAFGPEGALAVGDFNGSTYLWNIVTKSIVATLTDPRSQGIIAVAFGPDGLLAVADDNHSTYVWDTATRSLVATLTDPGGQGPGSVVFSPDGVLATGDGNGRTYLWNTATKGVIATIADPDSKGVASVAFESDSVLATGDANGDTYLWRISPGKF